MHFIFDTVLITD